MANIFLFPPQREFSEILEWKTEILSAKSSEQTICLRPVPRTFLEYDYIFNKYELDIATSIFRNSLNGEIDLPLWHQSDNIGALTVGQNTFTLNTIINRYYQVGQKAFISEYDNSIFEEVTISTVNSGSIVTETISNNYQSAYIMPKYNFYIDGDLRYRKTSSDYINASASFHTAFDFQIPEENSYSSFLDSFILDDKQITSGTTEDRLEKLIEEFDNVAGNINKQSIKTFNKYYTSYEWLLKTESDIWKFKKFGNYIKGRNKSFYLPRWLKDFEPSRQIDALSQYIYVKKGKYYDIDYFGPLTVQLNDNSVYHFNSIAIENYDSVEDRFVLDSNAGVTIPLSDVKMITRTTKSRVDSDRLEFSYKTKNVAKVKLAISESNT